MNYQKKAIKELDMYISDLFNQAIEECHYDFELIQLLCKELTKMRFPYGKI